MKSVIKTTRKSNSFYFQAVAGWGEGRSRAEGATTTWRPPGGAGSLLWELRAAAHVAGGARWRRPSPSAMSPAAPTGRAAGPSPGGAGGCSPSAAAEMSFSTSRRWAAGAGQGRTGRCGRRGGLKLGAFFPPAGEENGRRPPWAHREGELRAMGPPARRRWVARGLRERLLWASPCLKAMLLLSSCFI